MIALNKLKFVVVISTVLFITGCSVLSGSNNFALCAEAQKSISKDMVVMEAARIQALIEMTKSADPGVRAAGVMLLQKNDSKSVTLECLK
jgi:hypothetical protein